MSAATPVYLEDLAIGQRFTNGTVELTAESIKRFAAEYDPQDFHLDEAAAAASLFKGLAASGWHTAAITMRLLVTGSPPLAWGMIGAGGELRWPQPARVGDVLSIRAEVIDIQPSRSKPDRGMIRLRVETVNQRGEVVQEFTPRVLVPRRGAQGTAS